MADIYDNIENFKEILSFGNVCRCGQLMVENQDLKMNLDETTAELKQVKMEILQEFDKVYGAHQQLLINYSSLLKTARAEVERKADMMMNVHSNHDKRFLRLLYDRTNTGKGKAKGGRRGKKKSGSADICEQKIKTQTLKDEKDQPLERKDSISQQKSKTEYRIPKHTKPMDELVVPKKDIKIELQKEWKCKDDLTEKENKQRIVKAGSIFNRRKSMPVFRHKPVISSDEETESSSTVTGKSYSTMNETDAALDRLKQVKAMEQPRMKPFEPPSSDMRYSDHRQLPKMETRQSHHREQQSVENRHSDHREQPSIENRHLDREPPKDLRHKLTKNYELREIHKSNERYPSREDPRKHRERYEEQHNHDDRHRRFETNIQYTDPRLSRKDMHDNREKDRGRPRILESPPPNKYSRNKSRDCWSNYHQFDRQIEHISHRQRSHQDGQAKQKHRDEAPADYWPSSQQMEKPPEAQFNRYKVQPSVKSKFCDQDGEPLTKRRRVDSRTLGEDHGGHGDEQQPVQPMELVAMSPHTCQSPDELLVENVHVETPVKEIMNTVATGLEDPRLTSKRYTQIVEDKNRIRLSTVTGRNVDLVVLPPYSTDVFQSKDPNSKFEEYTEEDLVKDIYIDFDDKDVSDSMESGVIEDGYVHSDLINNLPSTNDVLEKLNTSNIVQPMLLLAPLDTPQMSQSELLQTAPVDYTTSAEVLQDSIALKEGESNEKPIDDEPSYSGVMAKKFRIPKRKSTESALEDTLTKTPETVPENLTSGPKISLDFILNHIKQKCGVEATTSCPTDPKGSSISKKEPENAAEKIITQFAPISTTQEKVSKKKHERRFSHGSKNTYLVDEPKAIKESLISDNSLTANNIEPIEKALTKRQIVAGDLELSDDENSANIDLHHTVVKEKKETSKKQTKPVKTRKSKTKSRTRKEQTEDKKTAEKYHDKEESKRTTFTELFGDSSSLITPEDLELYAHPHAEFESDIVPPSEAEAAVDIDMIDKATLTESGERRIEAAKIRTRSTNKPKKDLANEKPSKRVKATEKHEESKKTANDVMEGVPSEMVIDTAESSVVKTVIISTGTQPVFDEIPKSEHTPAVVAPTRMSPTTFKPFSQVCFEPITALATSTPCRDLSSQAFKITPPIPINNTNETPRVSDEESMQYLTADSLSQSKEVDAPDVRVILKRRRKRVIK